MKHYWQLLLVRTLTGISLGGTLPLIFSLVGDLFWAENRAQVAAGIQLATGVGFGVGQGIAAITGALPQSGPAAVHDLAAQALAWACMAQNPGIHLYLMQVPNA